MMVQLVLVVPLIPMALVIQLVPKCFSESNGFGGSDGSDGSDGSVDSDGTDEILSDIVAHGFHSHGRACISWSLVRNSL
jgi:hypothetical protein